MPAMKVSGIADDRAWWRETLAEKPKKLGIGLEPVVADAKNLMLFIERVVQPTWSARRRELENRPLVRAQALGPRGHPRTRASGLPTMMSATGS